MLISWNWLKQYVHLDMPVAELERRLMMAGLNHESTHEVGGDLAVDLEVTSNRPDCLGHLGIAREVAVLWGRELQRPAASPAAAGPDVNSLARVAVECPDLCPRYTARVISGVKIGPSPAWLSRRLATVGLASINNVVDVTNYVLMECGQPLHAFDLARLRGRRIIVRDARSNEEFEAINHKTYPLSPGTCVIADAERAVGLGGVMGGADSEVTAATTELLIESAEFSPRSIRGTARRLNLHSPSSYRFERGVDPEGVDWASRRCCELILELAGGALAAGVIDVGRPPQARAPVVLRLSQLKRILGIDIPADEVCRILAALGNELVVRNAQQVTVVPPSWRRDLTREIDLVEEVARIHGYDAIPEDVSVPMTPSARTVQDRALARIRQVVSAAGYDEAMTASLVDEEQSAAFSPWTGDPSAGSNEAQFSGALRSQTPLLRGADRLRRSLVPSLLAARRTNQSLANPLCELFEIAKVYLPRAGELPHEPLLLALTSGGDYVAVKGVLEAVVRALCPAAELAARPARHALLDPARSSQLLLAGETLGYLGEVSEAGRKQFDLRGRATVAEIDLALLERIAQLVPQYTPLSPYPAVTYDLNFEVDETLRWETLAATVRETGGPLLERLEYKETYRSEALGADRKSLLTSLTFRRPDGTLTGDETTRLREQIAAACERKHRARLRT